MFCSRLFVNLHKSYTDMTTHPLWQDDYWLLVLQLYMKKPMGVKSIYSRSLINLALELHIEPKYLYQQMFRIRRLDSPQMQQLWDTYAEHPKRLSTEVDRLRKMAGFGQKDVFYKDVAINESWEKSYRPLEADEELTTVALTMILDLYFRLTPITMVAETPEVQELARLLKIKPEKVAAVLEVFMQCDPYLNRVDFDIPALLPDCQKVWQRYGNDPEKLSAEAAQMSAWYK